MISKPAGPKARRAAIAESATFAFEETASCASWVRKSSEGWRSEFGIVRKLELAFLRVKSRGRLTQERLTEKSGSIMGSLESESETSAARRGAVKPRVRARRKCSVFMAQTSHAGRKELSGPGKRNVKEL